MGDIEDVLVDFLRRVAEGQQPAQPRPQPRPPQGAPMPPPGPRRPMPTRPPVPQRPVSLEPVIEAEVVEAEAAEDVATHVARHMDTQEFGSRASHLGEGVAHEQQQIESHLKQVFGSGPKGQLAHGAATDGSAAVVTSNEAAADRLALEIISLFRSPRQLRDAMILGEIMRRPEF